MEFNRVHIGEEIRRLMKQQHLTPTGLAMRIGRKRNVVVYRLRQKTLSVPILREMSKALGADLVQPFLSQESQVILRKGRQAASQAELEARLAGLAAELRAMEEEKEACEARLAALEKENEALRFEAEKQQALADSLRDVIATLRA